ncbi:hypothetical protein DYB30_013720, partial [Aphanomyces astaci]
YPVVLPPNGTFNYPPNASYISLVQQSPEQFQCLFPNGTQISKLNDVWDEPTDCFWPVDASEVIPMTQNTASPVVAGIYFTALMYIGMCFLLQLNMAVLFTEFEKAKDLQAKKLREDIMRLFKPADLFTRVSTVAVRRGDVIVQSAIGRQFLHLRAEILKIVVSREFINFGLVVTISNILVLSLDFHGIDVATKNNYETANFMFMLYFGVESLLKIVGLGLRRFWADKFNRFDLLTFFLGVVEAAISPPSFMDGTPGGSGIFTAFRAARAFKLARMWESLNQLLTAIFNSLSEILNFLLFLLLFMLIFSLLGMELFATHYQFDPNNYHMPFNNTNPQTRLHRSNFDSIVWAAFTVFQILSYDNFPAVMYDGWIAVGAWAPIYVSLVIILGVFVVMNMFSAILVQAVMKGNTNDDDNDDDIDSMILDSKHMDGGMRTKSTRILRRVMDQLARLQFPPPPTSPANDDDAPKRPVYLGRSLFLFAETNPLRRLCTALLQRREYTWAMSVIIFISCVDTALDSPLLDPNSSLGTLLDQVNLLFAVLFSVEMAINVVSRGLFIGRDAFVKDWWRVLDGFIVTVSILPYCFGNLNKDALTGLRSLRAFRALRPLRVINNIPSLKVVVNTLFRCIPDVGRALLFFFFMLFLFGLMSLALFKGALNTCSVSPYNYGLGTGTPVNPPWFPTDYTGDFNIVNVTVLEELDVMTFPRPWTKLTD